ncbi:helix-turn-helix domain-containing protein [Fibrisoma montanum]|nr:AraC family transcriptional regulator [Fibrisoma montanum]
MASLLHLFTAGSLLLTAFLLFTRPGNSNRVANRWMAVFLFILCLIFMDETLTILELNQELPGINDVLGVCILAVGPAYYLSVYAYTHPQPNGLRASLLHFLPFLLFLAIALVLMLLSEEQLNALKQQLRKTNTALIGAVIIILNISQLIAYCFFSLHLINRHQRTIALFASSPDSVDLSWLKYLVYCVFFMVVVWVFILIFPKIDPYTTVFYFASVYYVAYYALNQPDVFPFSEADKTAIAEVIEEVNSPLPAEDEPRKALLTPAELQEAKARLIASMVVDKLYLDNELTLPKLAEVTQLSIHKLSFLLNSDLGLNFYQFVNGYRIEEAKRLLTDPKMGHLSIEGIAYEAGFNSKTVFNTSFRKATGQSPSGYRSQWLALA